MTLATPTLTRWAVPLTALVAFLLRLPGLGTALSPDEAGFLMVARTWVPEPGSVYGHYFVDRPPQIIATFKVADAIGGPYALRLVGALVCAALVLLAARIALVIADERAARWTAVVVAALTSSTMINADGVKGELLSLPFVLGACLLAILALQRQSMPLAALAGLSAGVAPGFKQNMLGGLVFAAALLLLSLATKQISARTFARLSVAGLAGAAVPAALMIGWALQSGVQLDTLWYAIYGFRSDAGAELASASSGANAQRAVILLLAALGTGILLVMGTFVVLLRKVWRSQQVLVGATLALFLFDAVALVLGGSFWLDYLFGLLPAAVLATAMLAGLSGRGGRAMRVVVGFAAISSVASIATVGVVTATGTASRGQADTGEAIAAVAEPGDTVTVLGGRADLQLATGRESPYRHLWSLPMRTLDPEYVELRDLLTSPEAPTWFVQLVPTGLWSEDGGAELLEVLRERYDAHGYGCHGGIIWLRDGVERDLPEDHCPDGSAPHA
ncbi:hypothetical protein [Nocardioides sp. 616]|uniref:ArnT family glycosyltransferase n=1 Tax=Nocardioides sp. 616 TaxID=2268090 RepID=UPI0013B360F7|nr:hypothetical protein [Nocardioides sp. 616]